MKTYTIIIFVFITSLLKAQQYVEFSKLKEIGDTIFCEKTMLPYTGLVKDKYFGDSTYILVPVKDGLLLDGRVNIYNAQNMLKGSLSIEKGKITGIVYELYNTGDTLYVTDPFIDNKLTGRIRFFYPQKRFGAILEAKDMEIENIPINREHKIEGLDIFAAEKYLNGRSIVYYHNGNVQHDIYHIDGKPHGTLREYYISGQLKREGTYNNGKLEGKIQYYEENYTK